MGNVMQTVKILEHFEFSPDEETEVLVNPDHVQVVKDSQFMVGGHWFTCAGENPFMKKKRKRKSKTDDEPLLVLDD